MPVNQLKPTNFKPKFWNDPNLGIREPDLDQAEELQELLDEDKLERMIDILEKATGVAPAISQVRACAAWKGKTCEVPSHSAR